MGRACGYKPTIALSMPFGTESDYEAIREAIRNNRGLEEVEVNFECHHGDLEMPDNPQKWVIGIADDCCDIARSCELSTVAVYFALKSRCSVRITNPTATEEFLLVRYY